GVPAMFGLALTNQPLRDWRDLVNLCDWDMLVTINDYLINHGVLPEEGGFEPYFLCAAHTEADAAETLQVFEDGLKVALNKR
ncbi:MAG: hypothetical protein R3264_14590, partial [Anaerolineae bacterium]|nr:hypothetical protein [Anaerolineae bacterium]